MLNKHKKMIRILFFGDIFGRPGRTGVKNFLETKKDTIRPDFVIANSDNIASGRGPTENTYQELLDAGIDVLTCGDHVWDQKEVVNILEKKSSKLIRPANYPKMDAGRGFIECEVKGQKVLIVSMLGRVWTTEGLESPFVIADEIISASKAKIIFVDFHGEATSEKCAFGHYLAGRVSAVIGTHTHVQTSDEKILDEKTAYLTDAGFCGPVDSIIGVKKELSIKRFLSGVPINFEVADGTAQINGVILDIDEKTGETVKIERINELV